MSVHVNTSSPNISGCSVFTRPSGNAPWPCSAYGRDRWLLPKLGCSQCSSTTSPRPCVCQLSLFSFCKWVGPFFLLRPLTSALPPSKRFPGSFQKLLIEPRFTPALSEKTQPARTLQKGAICDSYIRIPPEALLQPDT